MWLWPALLNPRLLCSPLLLAFTALFRLPPRFIVACSHSVHYHFRVSAFLSAHTNSIGKGGRTGAGNRICDSALMAPTHQRRRRKIEFYASRRKNRLSFALRPQPPADDPESAEKANPICLITPIVCTQRRARNELTRIMQF